MSLPHITRSFENWYYNQAEWRVFNELRKNRRKKRKHDSVSLDLFEKDIFAEKIANKPLNLRFLDDKEREILLAYYVDNQTVDTIAVEANENVCAIRALIKGSVEKARKHYKSPYNGSLYIKGDIDHTKGDIALESIINCKWLTNREREILVEFAINKKSPSQIGRERGVSQGGVSCAIERASKKIKTGNRPRAVTNLPKLTSEQIKGFEFLSDKQRGVLIAYIIDGLNFRQIGDAKGTSDECMRVTYHRALKAIKAHGIKI